MTKVIETSNENETMAAGEDLAIKILNLKSKKIAKSKEKTKTSKVGAVKKDNKNYYIQIASFKNQKNAFSLINKQYFDSTKLI